MALRSATRGSSETLNAGWDPDGSSGRAGGARALPGHGAGWDPEGSAGRAGSARALPHAPQASPQHTAHWALDRGRASSFASLTPAQEGSLAARVQAGDRAAVDALVTSNLRHVLSIAQEYRRWGVPIDDLVQQGCLGLLKAAQRFDPSTIGRANLPGGGSLRAYAAYWIRAEIRDYVVRGYRIVRLGATRTERRALRAYRTTDVKDIDELTARSGMPRARCELLWPLLSRSDRSLDFAPPGRPSGLDLLSDDRLDPEATAMAREERLDAHDRVERAFAELSEREQRILWARLGADDPETLDEIGRRLGVSRERVRQIESRAKQKVQRALTTV